MPSFKPTGNGDGQRTVKNSGKLPQGVDLTLTELQEMATRQQRQLETQQQELVAKEQRLKFLKQQELRHQQIASENERLRKLREKVEAQELKLKKLRALRGQVNEHKSSNSNLTAELETIKALFNEKEKELALAVSRVEDLSRQLESARRRTPPDASSKMNPVAMTTELEKLRRQLALRNKLNEQQNSKLAANSDLLKQRTEELSSMDQRIAELQARHRKKKQLQQQKQQSQEAFFNLANQKRMSNVSNIRNGGTNVAAVEPFVQIKEEPDDKSLITKPGHYDGYQGNGKHVDVNSNVFAGEKSPSEKSSPVSSSQTVQSNDVNYGVKTEANVETRPALKSGIYGPRPFTSTFGKGILTNQAKDSTMNSTFNSPVSDFPKTSTPIVYGVRTSESQQSTPTSRPVQQGKEAGQPLSVITASSHAPNSTNTVQPIYQIATSRPQLPLQPQHADIPSPASSNSSASSANTVRANVQPPVNNQAFKPGNPPSATTSERYQSTGELSKSSSSHPAPENSNGGHQPHSEAVTDFSQSGNPTTYDTSPRISNTIKPTDINSSPKTYQYAKKEDIANTYLGRLNTNHLSQYRKNMSMLYGDYIKKETLGDESLDSMTDSPAMKAPYIAISQDQVTPPPLSPRGPAYDMDAERNHYAHRPLRRRLSSSESDEFRQLQSKYQQREAPGENSSTSYETEPKPDANVVNLEELQDDNCSDDKDEVAVPEPLPSPPSVSSPVVAPFQRKKTNLRQGNAIKHSRRVSFDPLALLLDASLEGELELVKTTAKQVPDPSTANDEGITALHNAICAGHYEIVKFLVEYGCDVNSPDSDGWTPLHCAASCNNLPMVQLLVEHGACIFATTISDQETAAEKCEEDEVGYDGCSQYLYSIQEKLGIINKGEVFAVFDYDGQNEDELTFENRDKMVVLRKGDEEEREWWWTSIGNKEGYVPRNLLGLYPRVIPEWLLPKNDEE